MDGDVFMPSRVLIVDDMSINLKIIGAMLEDTGYEVRTAKSGAEALKAVDAETPDLVLLDVSMPDMDGFEVCRRLKLRDECHDIPVIFVSGLDESVNKVEGLESGGVDYLTKPFQAEELRARVHSHLKMRWYRVKLAAKNLELEEALSRLKGAQTMLIQSERMASIGLLTAGVAHEINNPLSSVRASARAIPRVIAPVSAALSDAGQQEQVAALNELTDNIVQGIDRMATIVEGLRTFSRMDQGTYIPTDVEAGLESTLRLLRHRFGDRVVIERDFEDVPVLLCQPGAMVQVFTNLLTNALDALGSGPGVIGVRTRSREVDGVCSAVVEIRDSGRGIPPETQLRMFEPFFTTKPVGEGTGLGLAISHGIVSAHGGTLELAETSGEGSTFRITLPVRGEGDGGP